MPYEFEIYRDIIRASKGCQMINKINNVAEVYELNNNLLVIFDIEKQQIHTLQKHINPHNYMLARKDLSE